MNFIISATARLSNFTINKRKPALQACLLFGACFLTPQAAVAATVCYPDGNCFYSQQTCEDFIPGDGAVCTDTLMLNPQNSYLLSTANGYWLVSTAGKIPIASDTFDAFLKETNAKYRSQAKTDPKILKQVMADIAVARKKSDGKVSPDRLKSIAQKLNLRVLNKEPGK